MLLTTKAIENAKKEDEQYFLKDGGGLRVCVKPTGSKTFQHRIRVKQKDKWREVIRTLGRFPKHSLKEARDWKDQNNDFKTQGLLPPKKYDSINQASNDEATFKEMFDLWHKTMSQQWTDDYSIDTQQRADIYLLPQLGKLPLPSIKLGIVRDILLDFQETGKLDTVKKIKGIITRVLGFAVSREAVEFNVALSLSPDLFIKKKEKHYAHADTPEKLKKVLLKIRQVSSGQSVKTALMLVPHLLLRPGEVAELKWEYIDFDERLITIPAEAMKIKKKIHHVPLSNITFEIFSNLKKNSLDSPYCFPSPINKSKPIVAESLNRAIRRVGVTGEEFVIHGNRHTGATIIGNHLPHIRRDVVDAQLHHKITGVSGIYNRADFLEERKPMMEDWSNYLDNLLTE
jgi:integrase